MLMTPDASVTRILLTIVGARPSEPVILRLYANDWKPSKRDTEASYLEVTGGGYKPILLAEDEWMVIDKTLSTVEPKEFIFTGATGPIYGYYLTQVLSGGLLWAERFAGISPSPRNHGDLIVVKPTWRLTEALF